MYKKSLKIMSLLLVLCISFSFMGLNPANAVQSDKINNMLTIAENEEGYLETTYDDGTFYSKYGDWYGYPNGAWCAMFVSWCANQANISTNVIPKFASCSTGRTWFQNKGLWKNKGEYEPKPGDLIFFNNCSHVGIVKKFDDDMIYTIEGNAADENGNNYGVRERQYAISSSKITGYGIPDTEILNKFNGAANQKAVAYMLPDSNSATVWEVWENDDLEILCEENDFYLVMYPFLSTGKFVSAYIKKDVANVSGSIPNANECYNINKKAICITSSSLYHNASDESLLSSTGVDKKIRATLSANTEVNVLFEKDGFYFVRNDSVSGFIKKENIKINESTSSKLGDINGDNFVTISDATHLQGYIADMPAFSYIFNTGDLNGDGYIDVLDVTLIQMYISGHITKFPIENTPVDTKPTETVVPTAQKVEVSSIEVQNSSSIYLNEQKQIEYKVLPENATDKTIVWSSSNSDVVSVNQNGLVTANNAGTAIITAKSSNASVYSTSTIRVNRTTTYLENGTYCLKLKGTSSYLDHQGGTSNGTNVHLWSGDGNSNNNQKIVIDRIDDNRYMLRSATSNNLLIDVNRGSSYSDPIAIGKNIDLWENNDWEAQEWLFTKTYDGYYIIRLNMYQNGAIEAGGKDNGANIFFGTYNPENDMQKWEIVKSNPYVEPETTMWVCNTGDIGNVNVRSGPGKTYSSIGGFNEGQQVTVIGSTSAEWLKVRGANRHGGGTIEGYSHRDYYTTTKPSESNNPAPNLYSASYNASNPFAQCNLYGQCTWYAWGRANEILGINIPCRNNANTWYSVAKNNGYAVGATPRKNSIAVWSKGQYGHVAFVEKVEGDSVTITESNWDRVTYDYQYNIESGIKYYSGYKTLSTSQMQSRYGTLLGYIYL